MVSRRSLDTGFLDRMFDSTGVMEEFGRGES